MNQKPGLLTRLVVSSLAVFVADWLLPGVTIDSFATAIGVAIVLGILNATLKPLLIIITNPADLSLLGIVPVDHQRHHHRRRRSMGRRHARKQHLDRNPIQLFDLHDQFLDV